MTDESKKFGRRAFLSGGITAGFGCSIVFPSIARAKPQGVGHHDFTLYQSLGSAKRVTRSYTALDSSGSPTHALRLAITMPTPDDGTLQSSCWISRVRVHNLLPNPATGFTGGIETQYVEGPDSVATYLMALDMGRSILAASHESQLGSVVWSEVPQASDYGLPTGVANLPASDPAQPLASNPLQDPIHINNPRISHPCGKLDEIALVRDLERTDMHGSKSLVRMLFGTPHECQGPAPDMISYSCTFQIQGLQAGTNPAWPDGIITGTGDGLDPMWALVMAMQFSLGVILSKSEGSQPGYLQWLAAPSVPNWGLPRYNPNSLASANDLNSFVSTLPPHQQTEVLQLLAIDWDAYYD